MQLNELLPRVREAAAEAGEAIMEIYADPDRFETERKDDNSPLTAADLAANRILMAHLGELTPDIPILSEEAAQAPWDERCEWQRCWVVDPLDGTREFIKRNGEFTVNVALVDDHRPVLGVVYAPALERGYFAAAGLGAWRRDGRGEAYAIGVSERPDSRPWKVVGSRSHPTPAVARFIERLGEAETVAMGSSLKLCLVAEGSADVYPRLGPTSEWDTCAAQAVVEAAGGQVVNAENGRPLTYNARETLLNPFFIACGCPPEPDWFGPVERG